MKKKKTDNATFDTTFLDKASMLDNLALADELEEMCVDKKDAKWLGAVAHTACHRLRQNYRDWHNLAESIGPETEMDERVKQFVGNLLDEYNRMKRHLEDAKYRSSIDNHNFEYAIKARDEALDGMNMLTKTVTKVQNEADSLRRENYALERENEELKTRIRELEKSLTIPKIGDEQQDVKQNWMFRFFPVFKKERKAQQQP